LDTELVVLGGGPAGMAAAVEAAENGVRVILIDEQQKLGGQIYRQFPDGFHVDKGELEKNYLDKDYLEGQELIEAVNYREDNIKVIKNSLVWGIFPEREIAFIHDEQSHTLKYQKLVLSEGTYERPIPFPGWTLPGVFTAGGAQSLLKNQRVLPGEKILLAGTGPLQLVLANQLLKGGAKVVAVLEASSSMGFKHLSAFIGQLRLVKEGIGYLKNLRRAKIPFLRGHAILEARGEEEVAEAVYAKLDDTWKPIPGTEETVEVDTICVGYGFISSIRLSYLCGCEHRYDNILGCWVPKYDENMETNIPGVFVAGDGAGVAGHLAAIEEGRLCGLNVAQQLGKITEKEAENRRFSTLRKLKGIRRFEDALNEMSAIRPGLYSRITDDTIICRCEEITAGEIRNIILHNENVDLTEIKEITRAGMGNCQGRMCMSAIAAMVSIEKSLPIEKLGRVTYRPPTKPIRLSTFLQE